MDKSIAVFKPMSSPFGIARLNFSAITSCIFLSAYFRISAVFSSYFWHFPFFSFAMDAATSELDISFSKFSFCVVQQGL